MKNIVIALSLILISSQAFAERDRYRQNGPDQLQGQGQGQGQLQGQAQGQGQGQGQAQKATAKQGQGQTQGMVNKQDLSAKSYSESGALAGAASKSNSDSAAKSNSNSANGDQKVNVRTRYDAVTSSAAALYLPYCGTGASAQSADYGMSMAQVAYICEAQMALSMSMILVEADLASFDANRENDKLLADEYLISAHNHMMDSEEIIIDVVSYIDQRRNTAGIESTSKALAWPIGMVGLLIFLL
jgi:hypothetical protein